jgi:hypothetical protein
MVLETGFWFGLIVGAGSIVRCLWSFIKLKKDDPSIKWDWITFVTEAIPSFAAGFAAGILMSNPLTLINGIMAFFGGAGLVSMTTKLKKK